MLTVGKHLLIVLMPHNYRDDTFLWIQNIASGNNHKLAEGDVEYFGNSEKGWLGLTVSTMFTENRHTQEFIFLNDSWLSEKVQGDLISTSEDEFNLETVVTVQGDNNQRPWWCDGYKLSGRSLPLRNSCLYCPSFWCPSLPVTWMLLTNLFKSVSSQV